MMNQSRMTFFCLRHQELCYAARGESQVVCEQGPHALSTAWLRDRWEFCGDCQSFASRAEHEAARDKCPVCDRRATRRFLCDRCETLSFDTQDQPVNKQFAIAASGMPQPACPCCLAVPQTKVHAHHCDALRASVYTARVKCPACGNATASLRRTASPTSYLFPPTFAKPVSEYLQRLQADSVRGGTIPAHPDVLTANASGQFWLLPYRDDHFIALPGAAQFGSPRDYAGFQPFFDCEPQGAGEVVIHAPAVTAFDPATHEYVLTQKGRLEVRAVAPVSPPLSPPASPLQPPALPASPKFAGSLGLSKAPPDAPVHLVAQPLAAKPLLLAAIGGAALLVFALVVYFLWPSPQREIIAKLKQGQLVTPPGGSAYDVFKKGGLSGSGLDDVRAAALPLLSERGNQVIKQLVDDGYNPSTSELGDASRVYEWLDQLSPQNAYKARQHYFQGRQAYESKDYNGAENEFRQAMRLDAGWALPVNTLARVFLRRKDFVGAQNCYQRAIELDPKWVFPRINLCVLSVDNTRNYTLAEDACRGVLQLDPSKAAGHYFLGRTLEERGGRCNALQEYRQALGLAANSTNPGFNVERLKKREEQLSRQWFCN